MSRERQNKMYDWHRIFVQAIMSRGIMTGTEVFSLVRDICEEFKGRPGFAKINLSASQKEVNQDIAELIEELYTVANYSLEKIQFQIKKGFEETKTDSQYTQYYSLVPTEENESFYGSLNDLAKKETCLQLQEIMKQIAKLQKNMTEPELELLKLICIHLIEDRPDKTDTETNLINQCIKGGNNASKKKLTQLEAAKTLKGFIAEGYLTKRGTRAQKGGRIGLGARLMMELEVWLEKNTNIESCTSCSKPVTISVLCTNKNCDAVFHKYCVESKPKCTSCKQPLKLEGVASKR